MPVPYRPKALTTSPIGDVVPWGINHRFRWLSPCTGWVAYALRTRAPLSSDPKVRIPFDLHVLGLPLAFILSQDQTLRCIVCCGAAPPAVAGSARQSVLSGDAGISPSPAGPNVCRMSFAVFQRTWRPPYAATWGTKTPDSSRIPPKGSAKVNKNPDPTRQKLIFVLVKPKP